MKSAAKPAAATPILTITRHGTVLTFDPTADRWTVMQGANKASSAQYDRIAEKMQSWEKQASSSAPQTDPPVDGAALTFSQSNGWGDYVDKIFAGAVVPLEPMHIKLQWSVKEAKVVVVRHRELPASNRTSDVPSWESRRSGAIWLHPDALEAEDRDLWAQAFVGRAIAQHTRAAEQEIAQAWMANKSDETQLWSLNNASGPVALPRSVRKSARDFGEVVVPASVPWWKDIGGDLAGWEQAPEGRLEKEGVCIVLEGRSDVNRHQPDFHVCMKGDDGAPGKSLYKDGNWTSALWVANATVQAFRDNPDPVALWHGSLGWEKPAPADEGRRNQALSWPRLLHITGVAAPPVLRGHRSLQDMLFLGEDPDKELKSLFLGEEPDKELKSLGSKGYGWHTLPTRSYNHETLWFAHDRVDGQVVAVQKNLIEDLNAKLKNIKDGLKEGLKGQCEKSLALVHQSVLDGEPASAPQDLYKRWRAMEAKWVVSAQDHPEVVAWAERCAREVAQVKATLASVEPSVARSRRP